MNTLFKNPTLTCASQLGIALFEETEPIKLSDNVSETDLNIVIRAIYRQVLGNAHLMENEQLTVAESQLRQGEITVREFVRQLALSDSYLSRFYFPYSSLRFIELNFKHLLGRAPESHQEITEHIQILNEGGVEAEINSYLDSPEYSQSFGEAIVPYYRGYKTETDRKAVGFPYILQLLRGSSSSDASSGTEGKSRLQKDLLTNTVSPIVPLSTPPATATPLIFDARTIIAKALGLPVYATAYPSSTQKTPEQLAAQAKQLEQESALQRQYRSLKPSTQSSTIELLPTASDSDVEIVIQAVYRQVLGNAHVMESERLIVPESQLKRGEISVREFVRQVAKSELYRSRFFDCCPRYRSIELNFKHLLGRAPNDYSETFYHSQVLDNGGFDAEIDAYIDSDEYQNMFGENIVPYYQGYQTKTGQKLLGFTNMFKLLPSLSTSDKASPLGNSPQLNRPLIYNNPQGNAPLTDVKSIIREALKPKSTFVASVAAQSVQPPEVILSLQRQCTKQKEEIESLEKQLADLLPTAMLGDIALSKFSASGFTPVRERQITTTLPSPHQSQKEEIIGNDYSALQRRSEQQAEKIAMLQEKLTEARRLAVIGNAKTSKWRNRYASIR